MRGAAADLAVILGAAVAGLTVGTVAARAMAEESPTVVVVAGPCMDHDELVRRATEIAGQRPDSVGLSAVTGSLLEILVGPDGGWTAIAVEPHGRACVVDFGVGWLKVRKPEGSTR